MFWRKKKSFFDLKPKLDKLRRNIHQRKDLHTVEKKRILEEIDENYDILWEAYEGFRDLDTVNFNMMRKEQKVREDNASGKIGIYEMNVRLWAYSVIRPYLKR